MSGEVTEDHLEHLEREGITRQHGVCFRCQKEGEMWRLDMPYWEPAFCCTGCALEELRWRLIDS